MPQWGAVMNYGASGGIAIATGDLDHNGTIDVVVATFTDVIWFPGKGNGQFTASQSLISGTPIIATGLIVTDTNGDGYDDVITWKGDSPKGPGSTSVSVYYQLPANAGHFGNATSFAATNNVLSVQAAKLDADAFMDLVVFSGNVVQRFIASSAGAYSTGTTLVSNAMGVDAEDIDNDGLADIVVVNALGGSVYFNEMLSPNTFEAPVSIGGMATKNGGVFGHFSSGAGKDLLAFGNTHSLDAVCPVVAAHVHGAEFDGRDRAGVRFTIASGRSGSGRRRSRGRGGDPQYRVAMRGARGDGHVLPVVTGRHHAPYSGDGGRRRARRSRRQRQTRLHLARHRQSQHGRQLPRGLSAMTQLVNIGDVLAGKYKVDKILGIGGMGMVVSAMHLELDQRVALKFMLPDALASEQATERFLREAKAAVKLRSEHVCRVLDVGKLDTGAPYIVMEFMEGEDFAQMLKRRGPLDVAEACDYLMQALEGLAEAHANGIVHRDLKPGNLFVTTDNDGSPLVKVLDFGISKSSIGGSATKTGDIMGSPAYMAPEQMASSKNVDARADLWAVGVIAYQAVTNRLPFEADTLPALCMCVMGETPVSPEQIRADLAPAFGKVVMRCLEKSAAHRYGDLAELAAALAPFASAEAATAAKRIGKVLKRTATTKQAASEAVAATMMARSNAALIAPTEGVTGSEAPLAKAVSSARAASEPPGRISTLQASAAELRVPATTKSKRPIAWIAAAGAVAIAGAATMFVVFRGGDAPATITTPQPAAQPAPVATPAPAPPVTTQPAPTVATPPVATPPPIATTTPAPPPVVAPTHKSTHAAVVKKSATPAPTPTATPPVETPKPVEAPKPEPAKPVEPKVEPPPATTPPATPAKPEDKWTHMRHDKKGS